MPHQQNLTRAVLLALPVLFALQGFGTINKSTRDSIASGGYISTSGVNQLFDEEWFEKIDLPNLLDQIGRAHV